MPTIRISETEKVAIRQARLHLHDVNPDFIGDDDFKRRFIDAKAVIEDIDLIVNDAEPLPHFEDEPEINFCCMD